MMCVQPRRIQGASNPGAVEPTPYRGNRSIINNTDAIDDAIGYLDSSKSMASASQELQCSRVLESTVQYYSRRKGPMGVAEGEQGGRAANCRMMEC
jgi:hypothetical protein